MQETTGRVRGLLEREGADALVVSSPANRRYLTGFTGTAGTVVIGRSASFLLTDFRYVEQVKAQAPGFELVQYEKVDDALGELLEKMGARKVAFESEHTSVKAHADRREKIGGVTWLPIEGWLERLRARKTSGELESIEKAVAVADSAFDYIIQRLKGRTEKEVAFDLEFFMRKEGAERLAFPSIVASGPSGALPHAVPGDRTISDGDLVTLDYGAVVEGYCSDMTRTVSVGKADDKQRAVYGVVLDAQLRGLEAVRPGRTGREVDADARRVVADAGYGEYFGHGLGHGVGLDIHEDPPRLSKLNETALEPDMVTSVEPGIYLPGWGGVRIEDLVVVTATGCRVLTQSPKDLIEV